MYIVHVHVHVKPQYIAEFTDATKLNAYYSRLEKGIKRFDLMQSQIDESYFILNEVYLDEKAAINHKNTAHYQNWRDSVTEMMAEPRSSDKFINIDPVDEKY